MVDANAGKSFSMGNQLTFSGSGELDNGLNVSLSFVSTKTMTHLKQMELLKQVTQELHLTVTQYQLVQIA